MGKDAATLQQYINHLNRVIGFVVKKGVWVEVEGKRLHIKSVDHIVFCHRGVQVPFLHLRVKKTVPKDFLFPLCQKVEHLLFTFFNIDSTVEVYTTKRNYGESIRIYEKHNCRIFTFVLPTV